MPRFPRAKPAGGSRLHQAGSRTGVPSIPVSRTGHNRNPRRRDKRNLTRRMRQRSLPQMQARAPVITRPQAEVRAIRRRLQAAAQLPQTKVPARRQAREQEEVLEIATAARRRVPAPGARGRVRGPAPGRESGLVKDHSLESAFREGKGTRARANLIPSPSPRKPLTR